MPVRPTLNRPNQAGIDSEHRRQNHSRRNWRQSSLRDPLNCFDLFVRYSACDGLEHFLNAAEDEVRALKKLVREPHLAKCTFVLRPAKWLAIRRIVGHFVGPFYPWSWQLSVMHTRAEAPAREA